MQDVSKHNSLICLEVKRYQHNKSHKLSKACWQMFSPAYFKSKAGMCLKSLSLGQ